MNPLSRRGLLRTAALGACLAVLPRSLRAEAPAPVRPPNSAIYRFRVGDFEAAALVTGLMDPPPRQPFFAPQASAEDFRATLAEAGITKNLRLHFNVLLLRTGRDNILIDVGPGGKTAAPFDLTANLALLGLAPTDITMVLLTHAHFDHASGLLDAQDRTVFSRAEHFCLAEEIDFWMAPQPDFSRLRMNAASLLGPARRVFEKIPFTRIQPTTRLPDGVTPILSPGHTAGHMTLRLESAGETLYHIADLIHHAGLQMPHPDWTVASDLNEAQAAATRQTVFAQLAGAGTRVFGCHLPFPGLGRLGARGSGYQWLPEYWDPAV